MTRRMILMGDALLKYGSATVFVDLEVLPRSSLRNVPEVD